MAANSDLFVDLHISGGIARLTLNRPAKRNALTREFLRQIADAVGKVSSDSTVRLLVLSAAGPVFCAGMDLGEMQDRSGRPNATEFWQQDTQTYRDVLVSLFTLPMPTLCVVQGPALAGGMGLVLACDIVVAAEKAFFSLPEPQRGIAAAVLAPLLAYRVGAGSATYLLLSGRSVFAADAHRIGLCHEVASAESLADHVRRLSASILTGAPSALSATKRHIITCVRSLLVEQLDAGMKVSAEARQTSEAREGLQAFLEKRKPAWQPDENQIAD